MRMCTHIQTQCVRACIHRRTHTHKHARARAQTHRHTHEHKYTRTNTQAHTCVHTQYTHTRAHTHTHAHMHMHAHVAHAMGFANFSASLATLPHLSFILLATDLIVLFCWQSRLSTELIKSLKAGGRFLSFEDLTQDEVHMIDGYMQGMMQVGLGGLGGQKGKFAFRDTFMGLKPPATSSTCVIAPFFCTAAARIMSLSFSFLLQICALRSS